MKFSMQATKIENQHKGCLIVGVFANGDLTPAAAQLDKESQHYIRQLLKTGKFQAKVGQNLSLHNLPPLKIEQVLLVGCGNDKKLTAGVFRRIVAGSIRSLAASKTDLAITYLTDLSVEEHDLAWKIQHIIQVAAENTYRFDQFKSEKDPLYLQELIIHVPSAASIKANERVLQQTMAIAEGVKYTRDLANLPSNICTPTYLADEAKILGKRYKKLSVKILEKEDMAKLGMGALLAVAKGSIEKPKLICLQYQGAAKSSAPIVFVGKGITFDTGGISLKPADSMIGMKYDMCGAATVLGVLKTAAQLKLPLNVIGVIASAENMPSGSATKPEDIVKSLSGQTIEILNTDAEGRLVLCDALTYCERFKPDTVIDIATLTGAVVIALGHHATALLSNNPALTKELQQASDESYDRVWPMPLWDDYQEQIRSPFADMANVGGRGAGAITAACFLSRFTKKFRWAHLDVAGTAAIMFGNQERNATGRPVPLLMQYLLQRSKGKRA